MTTTTTSARAAGLGSGFRAQLASTGLANLGDGVLATLAPLVALSLTSSPALIAALTAAAWVPWLLFGIAAGVIIDRSDRRRAQVVALTIRAAVLALGAALSQVGVLTMPVLIGLLLIYGTTEVFADLGATSIVPDLVPAERLPAANGRLMGVQQVANAFLGSPLAGVLIVLGAGAGFGVSAALAALAALILLVGLRGDYRTMSKGAARPAGQVREGLAFLVGHPVLRPLVVTSSLLNLASTAYFAVFVLWAVGPSSAVGLTPAQYPFITLGLAVGAVAGSMVAARLHARLGEVRTIVGSLLSSVVLMLVPVLWPTAWALVAAFTLVGVTNTVGNVLSLSLRQRLVPGVLLGRIGGASRTLSYGLMPLGALIGGVVAQAAGLQVTFYGAVALSVLACAYLANTLRHADLTTGAASTPGA